VEKKFSASPLVSDENLALIRSEVVNDHNSLSNLYELRKTT